MKPPANIAPILNVQNVPLDRIHPSGWNNRPRRDPSETVELHCPRCNLHAVGRTEAVAFELFRQAKWRNGVDVGVLTKRGGNS